MWRTTVIGRKTPIRFNSTSARLIRDLVAGNEVGAEKILAGLKGKSLSEEEKLKLHDIVKNKQVSNDVINEVLHHGLLQDFSLYHTANRSRGEELQWSTRALESLLKANPGRTMSLAQLLAKHCQDVTDDLKLILIDKELNGDIKDDEDSVYTRTPKNFETAARLLKELLNLEEHRTVLEELVDKLIEDKVFVLEHLSGDPVFLSVLSSRLDEVQDPESFLKLARSVVGSDVSLANTRTLARYLREEQSIEKLKPVIAWVEENKFDLDKYNVEALLIRIELMDVLGMRLKEMKRALERFHHYQSHEKFGIDLVQAKLSQAFYYQAMAEEDETLLKVANALLTAEEIPVNCIAQRIVTTCVFDANEAINLYNDFLGRVSKKRNEVTGRSPSGVLMEALIVGSLNINDRLFARFLIDKAQQHKVADAEELALLKTNLKSYGDCFGEGDTWTEAKPRFRAYALGYLRGL